MNASVGEMLANGKYRLNVPLSLHKGGVTPRRQLILGTPNTLKADVTVRSINGYDPSSINLEVYTSGRCYWTFNNGELIESGKGQVRDLCENKIFLSDKITIEFESHEAALRALHKFKLTDHPFIM